MTTTIAPHTDPDVGPPRERRRSLSAWCADRRWRTLLAALAVLAGAILLLGNGFRLTDETDQLVGDSKQAEKALEIADFGDKPTEHVVVSTRTGRFDTASMQALSKELRSAYSGVAGIAEVAAPVLAEDRKTFMVPVILDADPDDADAASEAVGPMLKVTERLATTH